jgi:arsenate reductase
LIAKKMTTQHTDTQSSMSKVILFGIKNCDTMKKAFNWLTSNGVDYEFTDYKKAGVAAAHLADWSQRAGWETLLNKRGLTWKKLTDAERADVNETKAIELMTQHPSLIKRPVLDTGRQLIIGFTPENYAEQLK